ncbi:hypothetical protein DQX05_25370 [Paenibacillus thiaminolyticus]|uniref:Uncharacterized protein n=1 Tax=Paenibacillus thiaminolyticus TaxID=49283 RepID=A0A3A3GAI0_PANTH|nr:hypothetical protein DQX05_25370 [Paenibacillus thiaminolyticus]
MLWTAVAVLGPTEAEAKPSYPAFDKVSTVGQVIPGLNAKNEWVPQGLAVIPGKNWGIVSHYSGKSSSQASAISITDTKTKKRIKTLYLYESANKKHTGHVGGVAASAKYIWIASGKSVYQIPVSTVSGKKDYSNVIMKNYSQSCGRNNDSTLLVYTREASGKQVSSLKMPPMSEGISQTGSSLYVLFESGARKYADGKYPLKNMYIINIKKLKL